MITKIYVQSTENRAVPKGILVPITLLYGSILAALQFQQEHYEAVLEVCKQAEPNSIIVCPEIGLHIDRQQRLIDDINTAIGDKPLQIFTQSATIFFPHHRDLVKRL